MNTYQALELLSEQVQDPIETQVQDPLTRYDDTSNAVQEKFNNRLNEFGLLLTGNLSIPTIMQGDNVTINSETGVEKLKYTVGLFAIYAHNFFKAYRIL